MKGFHHCSGRDVFKFLPRCLQCTNIYYHERRVMTYLLHDNNVFITQHAVMFKHCAHAGCFSPFTVNCIYCIHLH